MKCKNCNGNIKRIVFLEQLDWTHEGDFFQCRLDGLVFAEPSQTDLLSMVGETIWNTSRKDEGTISFAGANIVAQAVIDKLNEEGLLNA